MWLDDEAMCQDMIASTPLNHPLRGIVLLQSRCL